MIQTLRMAYYVLANSIIAIYFVPIFIINFVLIIFRNIFLLFLVPISYIALIIYGNIGFFLSAFGGYENLVKPAFLEFYKWQAYAIKKFSMDEIIDYPSFISWDELENIEKSMDK